MGRDDRKGGERVARVFFDGVDDVSRCFMSASSSADVLDCRLRSTAASIYRTDFLDISPIIACLTVCI